MSKTKAKPVFQIMKVENGKFFFILIAKNGKCVSTSETYDSKENCIKGIKSVKKCSKVAKIEDKTEPTL